MTAVRPLTSRRSFFSFWIWDDSGESTAEREAEAEAEAVKEESDRRWWLERGRRAGSVNLREFGGENLRSECEEEEEEEEGKEGGSDGGGV